MNAYRLYEISSGSVSEGVLVGKLHLKGANTDIPAILIGEEGRGRDLGVLPVQLTPGQYKVWQEKGQVRVFFAELGETKSGKPKLFAKETADNHEKMIAVFKTMIGFRGGNNHTGDKFYTPCPRRGQKITGAYSCPECDLRLIEGEVSTEVFYAGTIHPADKGEQAKWKDFPGEVVVKGYIAQGQAGGMGSGEQLVAVLPKNVVFRTSYSGRLYGKPSAHYYVFNGEKVLSATWDERTLAELF